MPTLPTLPTIDPTQHLVWARAIARGVRRDFKFWRGSQEEADLEATAYLELCRAAGRFDVGRVPAGGDVDGAFRGFASWAIRDACQTEAYRLKNAGTYWIRRESDRRAVAVEYLSGRQTKRDGSLVELADPRSLRPGHLPDEACGGDDDEGSG